MNDPRRLAWVVALACVALSRPLLAGPDQDRQAFRTYFEGRFPGVPFTEFANGIYAIDEGARQQWQEIEEFPPYEFKIEDGRALWAAPFSGGASYADCFGSPAVRHEFPRFDASLGEVVTLEYAINLCREQHGEPPLDYGGEAIIALSAFMAYSSRGQEISVRVPEDDPAALAKYEEGKRFYYSKRGQLNFACSDCHVVSVGQYVRADRLSPSLGHPSHFPVYRSKLGRVISLHERFYGCVRDVRARPFELQSEAYRNLEYFLTFMSNGLPVNGPGARK
jgi:sulfur-oxidizing protein SoxA